MLQSLFSELAVAKIEVLLADVRTPVRERLRRSGLREGWGESNLLERGLRCSRFLESPHDGVPSVAEIKVSHS